MDLEQVKNSFDPSRHPDVLKGYKTTEEAKFEFCNLFTSLHSANKWFRNDTSVKYEDFLEWHTIVNTQIERDVDFRNLITNVWSTQRPNTWSGKQAIEIAKTATGAREMYHHDFHRVTFGDEQILAHSLPVMAPDAIPVKPITGEPESKFRLQPVPEVIKLSDCELAAKVSEKIKKRGAKGIFGL